MMYSPPYMARVVTKEDNFIKKALFECFACIL